MGITNLGRTYQSDVTTTLGGEPKRLIQTYNQTWLLKLDDPNADEGYVGQAPGLPFVGMRSPELPAFRCIRRDFNQNQTAPELVVVSVEWTTDLSKFQPKSGGSSSPGGSGGPDNFTPDERTQEEKPDATEETPDTPPWRRAGKWSIGTTYQNHLSPYVIYTGLNYSGMIGSGTGGDNYWPWTQSGWGHTSIQNGKAYWWLPPTNSAGQAFEQLEDEYPNLVYKVTFAALPRFVNEAAVTEMLNNINDAPVTMPVTGVTYPIGAVKYKSVSIDEDFFANEEVEEQYYTITQEFETNWLPGGFRIGLADIGDAYYPGGRTATTDPNEFLRNVDKATGSLTKAALGGTGDLAPLNTEPATIWMSTRFFNNIQYAVDSYKYYYGD